MTNSIGILE